MLGDIINYLFPYRNGLFVKILESKGGYCFFPLELNTKLDSEKLPPLLISDSFSELKNVLWNRYNVEQTCNNALKRGASTESKEVTDLVDLVHELGQKVLTSFKAEAAPVHSIKLSTKGANGNYYWHTDELPSTSDWKIGVVCSCEISGGDGTCFWKGKDVVSPAPGNAAIFLAEDSIKNIKGTLHTAPPYDDQKSRLVLIIAFSIDKQILESSLMINWVNSITNNQVAELPNIKDKVESEFSYNFLVAGLIAGEILKPGINCISSKLNGDNKDRFCVQHYQDAYSNVFSIKTITKAIVGEVVFGATMYFGGSLVNALTFRKILQDATEAIIDGKNFEEFSSFFSGDYSRETLSYLGNAALSTAITHYVFSSVDDNTDKVKVFVNAIACSTLPSLINLFGTMAYQGAAMLGEAYHSTHGWLISEDFLA